MPKSDNRSNNGLDDADVWQKFSQKIRPLPPEKRQTLSRRGQAQSAPRKSHTRFAKAGTGEGLSKPESANPSSGKVGTMGARPNIIHSEFDRKSLRRIRRGNDKIDARIDLHGLTEAQAHQKIQHFIFNAQAQGARLVLVITGKGCEGKGVLRQRLPIWIRQAPLAAMVLHYQPAQPIHGGDGAFYLRLRRSSAGG